jgi:glycosyltransferase involved in cell wall biosynthesis
MLLQTSNSAGYRVLLVAASLRGGGAERVMVTLSRHIDRQRFDTHMAVVSTQGPLLHEIPDDVVFHDLQHSRVRYCIPDLLRLIWRLRPSAILTTSVHLNLPLLAIRKLLPRGTKLFVRENSLPTAEATATGGIRQRALLYRWLYGHANAVICQSDAIADDLEQQFKVPREKMIRIYNPVDCARIRNMARATPNPFRGDGPHLVASGRLERVKGFDLLLDAMVKVCRNFPSADLSILGAGSLGPDLCKQCERLGLTTNVSFVGFDSNPFPYYLNADLFVLPSRYEGLPNAMLEAMALGASVVATDCPGGVREILKGWPNSRLAQAEDAASLANAILAALQSNRPPAKKATGCAFDETSLSYAVGVYENLLLS